MATKTEKPKKAKAAKPLDEAAEQKAVEAGAQFSDEGIQKSAERYARKLLKKEAGLRTSAPPTTGLNEDEAKAVRASLGIAEKAPKAEATEAAPAE